MTARGLLPEGPAAVIVPPHCDAVRVLGVWTEHGLEVGQHVIRELIGVPVKLSPEECHVFRFHSGVGRIPYVPAFADCSSQFPH